MRFDRVRSINPNGLTFLNERDEERDGMSDVLSCAEQERRWVEQNSIGLKELFVRRPPHPHSGRGRR